MHPFVSIFGVVITSAGAQVLNFSDLSPTTQAEMLGELKPAMTEACGTIEDDFFDGEIATLKDGDACLARVLNDPATATYVREEAAARCLQLITEGIRSSRGQSLRIKITGAQYKSLVDDVTRRLAQVNCAGPR